MVFVPGDMLVILNVRQNPNALSQFNFITQRIAEHETDLHSGASSRNNMQYGMFLLFPSAFKYAELFQKNEGGNFS
jgi:hypothetical protein